MHLLKSCEHLDRNLLNRESLFERVLSQVFVDRVLYVLNLECRNTLMEAISIVLRYVQEVTPLDYSEVVRFSDHSWTMVSAILPLNFECNLLLSLQVSVEVNDAKWAGALMFHECKLLVWSPFNDLDVDFKGPGFQWYFWDSWLVHIIRTLSLIYKYNYLSAIVDSK